jgi:hypothetical protein
MAKLLTLMALIFGPSQGITIQVAPLEYPWCGQAQGRMVTINTEVEEWCQPALPGIDAVAWVLIHEVCHIILPPLPDPHGPLHQECIIRYYQAYEQMGQVELR